MQNYINALLSDISYIKFDSNYVLNSENATSRGISAVEIDFFNNNFTILDQDGNWLSGFSATTFKATKDIYFDGVLQYRQGELFVANRGTEPTFTDLVLTDALNLADSKIIGYLTGIPVSQLDYLFTETMITSTLDTIISKAFGGLYGFDQTSNADAYLKQMYEKYSVQDVGPTINVTGHSLGGNLAFTSAVNNPSIVKSSYTYNAAGVDFQTYVILKVQSFIANNFPESLTAIESITNHFKNIKTLMQNSFGFYNDVGIQFTTADLILRHPEKRIAMVTEDMRNRKDDGFMANHSVKYLREISLVYEIIGTLLHNKSYDKYPEISEIINSYKIESYASQYGKDGNTLINFLLKNITDYMGINITPKSENGLSILEALSGTTATIKDYKSISATTTDNAKNRANIYALLNLVPFVIESGNNNFTSDIYNGNNYSQEFLDTRKDLMEKLIEFGNRGNKYFVFAEYIEILFPKVEYRDISVAYINSSTGKSSYLDLLNKTLVLENMTREEFFTDFNIPTTVFLTKNTLSYILNNKNSKVFDSFGNDSIQILNANAEIFLTSGNDTITIDMLKGGSLKKLEIKDGGLGDKIIFNATNDSDIVEGTIYNDIIIGNNQNDNLNGGDGDDTIYGDIDSHNINNYTGPLYIGNDTIDGGDGNDTIYGGTGSDILNGGNGNDTIYGSYSDSNLATDNILSDINYTNTINGGQGVDIIYGGEGKDIINKVGTNDMSYINLTNEQVNIIKNGSTIETLFGDRITGGKGDDEIYGTQYGDHYYYNSGDGNDDIYERRSGVGTNEFIDRIYIKNSFSNFSFAHNNTGDLTMIDNTTHQSVIFHGFMNLKYVEEFIFMTGSTENGYTYSYILDLVLNRTAQNIGGVGILNGNDLMDLSHTEKLNGISNITNNINGGYGRDIIVGGNLKDIINKTSSNSPVDSSKNYGDDITGGKGDDEIYGTNYGDTYNYRLGDGFDTIYETTAGDPTSENFIDRIVFNSSILATYISFKQFNSNLIILYNNIEIIKLADFMIYKGIEQMCFANDIIWDKYNILARIPKIDPEDPTKITGTDFNDVITGSDADDTIHGGNGDDIINGGKGNDILYGDNGNDTINGGLGNDEIHGGSGDDILNGNDGNDTIYGDDGIDTINGGLGSDTIYGGAGNDKLNGGGGGDTIYGGEGNDIINKGESSPNNIIIGGKGNDEIYGTFGNDTYHYTYGDGTDTIYETATNETYIDLLYLHGISPDDVEIYRQGAAYNDIYITIKSNGESVIIKNYYQNNGTINYLDQIIFDNGTIWKSDKIIEQAKYYRGTEGNDIINISNTLINIIDSGSGNDRITNTIKGTTINSGDGVDNINSSGNDSIIKSGNDGDIIVVSGTNVLVESGSGIDSITSTISGTINAGLDNDTIYLGNLKETIIYNIGDGKDTINTTGAGNDVYNITGYNKIDLSNIILSGKGKILELKFNGNDSLIFNNYINLLTNINNTMLFTFDNGSLTSNELKDLYTIINKAEMADNIFYDTVFSDQITGTDAADKINIVNGNGNGGFDIVNSGNGIDIITNKIDNTVINAGNDNDIIYTYGKNVTINGDAGDDKFYIDDTSYVGSGYLNGGEGNDTISFQTYTPVANNYIIEGGLGNDTIGMSRGTETIIFKKNDGNDTINITGTNDESQTDKLIIRGYSKNIITSENFILYDNSKSVILKLSETDNIKLVNFLSGKTASNNLKYFEFDDGTLTSQELIEKISQIKGTDNNDIIYDTVFNDTIEMIGGGDDNVYLKSGNDLLTTGNKKTIVTVQSSYNTINSGSGDDIFFIESSTINTINLKNSNNGHDIVSLGYLGKQSIIYVNVSATINISDTSVKGNGYTFSWGNDSSIHVDKSYVNTQVVFNYKDINFDDINLVGDDSDNYLKAISSKGQIIYGNGGVDTIYGSISDDFIYGGLGNDKIYGQEGDDHLYGDDGDDYIADTAGNNIIYGGNGNDTIYIGTGNDVVYGGNGNDYIESVSGFNGLDLIYGGDGDDTIKGSQYYGEFYGQNGNDTYEIYKGLIVDNSGSNTLIFKELNYISSDIRKTSNGFQFFKGSEILVDYVGIVEKIMVRSPSPDGYGRYASLVGNEINKLFELQAALAHEIETDNSTQKINELKSQMNYLWRTDTQ